MRSVTTYFCWSNVYFCNLRYFVEYVKRYKSASEMAKMTTFFIVCLQAYTGAMIFAKSTTAPIPRSKNSRIIGTVLAGLLVIMAVAQLFTFEDFPGVIADMWLPGWENFAAVLAAVIVTAEVFAVPFLLGMRLSIAMRIVSMVLGWVVVAVWAAISLWQNMTANTIGNAGILGNTASLPVGWWSVFVFAAMGVLVVWASWGMWPVVGKTGK